MTNGNWEIPRRYQLLDILEGALSHLRDGLPTVDPNDMKKSSFSCNAIYKSVCNSEVPEEIFYSYLDPLLDEMGLGWPTRGTFGDIPQGESRQQARAIWLTWVALMIEEDAV